MVSSIRVFCILNQHLLPILTGTDLRRELNLLFSREVVAHLKLVVHSLSSEFRSDLSLGRRPARVYARRTKGPGVRALGTLCLTPWWQRGSPGLPTRAACQSVHPGRTGASSGVPPGSGPALVLPKKGTRLCSAESSRHPNLGLPVSKAKHKIKGVWAGHSSPASGWCPWSLGQRLLPLLWVTFLQNQKIGPHGPSVSSACELWWLSWLRTEVLQLKNNNKNLDPYLSSATCCTCGDGQVI